MLWFSENALKFSILHMLLKQITLTLTTVQTSTNPQFPRRERNGVWTLTLILDHSPNVGHYVLWFIFCLIANFGWLPLHINLWPHFNFFPSLKFCIQKLRHFKGSWYTCTFTAQCNVAKSKLASTIIQLNSHFMEHVYFQSLVFLIWVTVLHHRMAFKLIMCSKYCCFPLL